MLLQRCWCLRCFVESRSYARGALLTWWSARLLKQLSQDTKPHVLFIGAYTRRLRRRIFIIMRYKAEKRLNNAFVRRSRVSKHVYCDASARWWDRRCSDFVASRSYTLKCDRGSNRVARIYRLALHPKVILYFCRFVYFVALVVHAFAII